MGVQADRDNAILQGTKRRGTIDYVIAVLGVALGLFALLYTQQLVKPFMDPVVETCSDADKFAKSSLHPYEGLLGGSFVCIITNFLFELNSSPEGVFIWNLIAALGFPAGVLLNVEAYRHGATGVVRFPTPITVLSQFIGISTVFPLAWLPGFVFGGSRDGQVSVVRVWLSLLLSIPFAVLSALLFFVLEPSSYAWTCAAGCLGGPAIALLPLFLWPVPNPSETSAAAKARGARALASVYSITGMLALPCYLGSVWLLVQAHGLDAPLLWDKLWAKASGPVAFMFIDTVVLYAGVLLFVLLRDQGAGGRTVLALASLPLLGPGASCALVLAMQERRAAAEAEAAAARLKQH